MKKTIIFSNDWLNEMFTFKQYHNKINHMIILEAQKMLKKNPEETTVYKQSNLNITQNIFEVKSTKQDKIIISNGSTTFDAELAISCIMIPKDGDIVSTAIYNNTHYIIAILKSYSMEPKQYHLKGLVKAGLDESYIDINPQNINLKTKNINLKSQTLSAIAKIGKWFIDGITTKAKNISQTSDNLKIDCKQKLSITTKNRNVKVTEVDFQKANTTIQDSKQINITTDKLNVNS